TLKQWAGLVAGPSKPQVRARAIARAWLMLRIDSGDRAPRYSPSSSLPSCSMQSALAYPASGSAGESLTQVGRSRMAVVSLIATTSPSRRLRELLDTTSHGFGP